LTEEQVPALQEKRLDFLRKVSIELRYDQRYRYSELNKVSKSGVVPHHILDTFHNLGRPLHSGEAFEKRHKQA
jgi:hypothetical protein